MWGSERQLTVASLLDTIANAGELVREVRAARLGGVELYTGHRCVSIGFVQDDCAGVAKGRSLTSDSMVMPTVHRNNGLQDVSVGLSHWL